MGGKYQFFQRRVEKRFFNKMKNGNTITQHIIAKQPQVTHKQYLSEIISTSVGQKQQHRQRLRDCILHAKVVTDIEKNKKIR